MKIRIKGDSIRLRLSSDEVEVLVEKHAVKDRCHFLGNIFEYGIIALECDHMTAHFTDFELMVHIPITWIFDWHKNDIVGFDSRMENGCFVLVEKDFKCLIPRKNEDEANLYPNPEA